MNIQKALERIYKKHPCDDHPNEWLLSFNKGVDGKWRLQGDKSNDRHRSPLYPISCFDDLCQRLSYDGEHTIVRIKIKDEFVLGEEDLSRGLYAFRDYHMTYKLGMNVMKKYYGSFLINLVGLYFLGRYPNHIYIYPRLKDERNYMGLDLQSL
jgi:hypothetical protein